MAKSTRRKHKTSEPGPCLPPTTYVCGAVVLTIIVMVVTVSLILRGEEPAAVCGVVAGVTVVAAGLVRRVLGPTLRNA